MDSSWHGVHGHDSSHEEGGYSSREVSNEDIWVFDIGSGNIVLEFRDIFVQRRGIGSVFFKDHLFGSEPGNGGPSDISLFEILVELGNKVCVGSQGYGACCIDRVFSEGDGPSEGGAFGHVGQDKHNFLVIIVVDILIYE